MSGYRNEWPCCGDETYTDAWEPERCPLCELNEANDRIAELETELQAARAQGAEPKAELFVDEYGDERVRWLTGAELPEGTKLYTQPQSAGVPEGLSQAIDMLEDYASALGNGDLDGAGHSTTQAIYEVIDLLTTTPQPAGDPWEKLPSDANKHRCLVYTPSEQAEIEYRIVPAGFVKTVSDATHYMPLKPPTATA